MGTKPLETLPNWMETEARITASLNRLCDIIAPDGEPSFVEDLQALTDALLDARPASCPAALEHRLDCLCAAAEELGRWAVRQEILALAVALTDRLH
jgi:hypothetical protein